MKLILVINFIIVFIVFYFLNNFIKIRYYLVYINNKFNELVLLFG